MKKEFTSQVSKSSIKQISMIIRFFLPIDSINKIELYMTGKEKHFHHPSFVLVHHIFSYIELLL